MSEKCCQIEKSEERIRKNVWMKHISFEREKNEAQLSTSFSVS